MLCCSRDVEKEEKIESMPSLSLETVSLLALVDKSLLYRSEETLSEFEAMLVRASESVLLVVIVFGWSSERDKVVVLLMLLLLLLLVGVTGKTKEVDRVFEADEVFSVLVRTLVALDEEVVVLLESPTDD